MHSSGWHPGNEYCPVHAVCTPTSWRTCTLIIVQDLNTSRPTLMPSSSLLPRNLRQVTDLRITEDIKHFLPKTQHPAAWTAASIILCPYWDTFSWNNLRSSVALWCVGRSEYVHLRGLQTIHEMRRISLLEQALLVKHLFLLEMCELFFKDIVLHRWNNHNFLARAQLWLTSVWNISSLCIMHCENFP